jgi:nitroimidazol reductase NimA-like FMN-containing flavoprotein (pyridoxamine 5'-phosphate oxidase superfamily)
VPREHAAITLTPDEIVEFISGQTLCIVATLDPDGSPWGDVAASAHRDGRLYFRLGERSRSRRNVEADPRVCCTLEAQGAGYYAMVSAMVHGEATPLGDGESVPELDALPDPVTGATSAGAVFSVDLEHVVSFDFAKIQRRFEQS